VGFFDSAILGLWLVFLGYWLFAATRVKRRAGGAPWRGAVLRAALAVGILVLIRELFRLRVWHIVPLAATHISPITASAGVAICGLGVAIAIWARVYLGRNWGMPMSLREGHELVTTGPYAFVRHPIYTGILLALIGSTLVHWFPRIVLLPVIFAYFIFAARMEERSMQDQFPNDYPAYLKRTKMLIPLLF
jgi:protein-S-isoprenylcysteine O-methyltransferase Ste14